MDDSTIKASTIEDSTVEALVQLTRAAGAAILEVYERDFEVEQKADTSPLTEADLAAHKVIAEGLARLTPDIPVLSEESSVPPFAERSVWSRYWLIDPLDGTKEFVNRNGEFTVNIALIDGGTPTLGFVGVPVQGTVYVGDVARGKAHVIDADGNTSTIGGRSMTRGNGVTVVASRSHGGERLEGYLDELSANFETVSRTPMGSSLKICILAAGDADLYPRLGPTSEWDIGAAHALLLAAGGGLWAADGSPMTYNAKESVLNPEFIAVADDRFPWREHLPTVPAKETA
ncbi:MAG: 3'(2'),5'-bisphosphate nucleotidase CysQ [Pseudomonadota bacterium]